MPSPKPNIRALERDHPNMHQPFTAARDRRNLRQAINAIPENLFYSLIDAIQGNSPHGRDARAIMEQRVDRDLARHLARHPD